ncbi:MAG: hypothetical protein J0L63_17720 [Anaerolineae bacterium]|nr:hypothetical protein [Anaerolineae bacterium]MBN8620757.1 hypothetical protein [Anaerolineae bacterium]
MSQRVLVVVSAPSEAVPALLDAISAAGGGIIGHYTHCAFTSVGVGHFKPDDAANPHVGQVARINEVDETRIETFCERAQAKQVAAAIRKAHPYEEPVIYLLPLLDESDL